MIRGATGDRINRRSTTGAQKRTEIYSSHFEALESVFVRLIMPYKSYRRRVSRTGTVSRNFESSVDKSRLQGTMQSAHDAMHTLPIRIIGAYFIDLQHDACYSAAINPAYASGPTSERSSTKPDTHSKLRPHFRAYLRSKTTIGHDYGHRSFRGQIPWATICLNFEKSRLDLPPLDVLRTSKKRQIFGIKLFYDWDALRG